MSSEGPADPPDPPAPEPARSGDAERRIGWRLRLKQQLRVRRLRRLPLVSPRLWLRRVLFWCGAVLVALVAIGFARAADGAQFLFLDAMAFGVRIGVGHLLIFVLAPVGLMLSVLLTMRVFPGAQGSGIPQVIAAMHMRDQRMIGAVLSARIAIGKILLTLLGLACGASIGREGPTVQVGASIMFALGRLSRLPRLELQRSLVLAGGAAGISAAFNTPLAGVVFAIEELAHSFEARTSGMTLTAVVIAGITTLALVGNYTYFGVTSVDLAFGPGWLAVLVCGVVGGLAGGVFSYLLTIAAYGRPRWLGRFVLRQPLGFAAICGALLAVFGWLSDGATCGTGYPQARQILAGTGELSGFFPFLKLAATVVSYLSGIPGGIFSPSLAVGAGLGGWLSQVLPGAPPAAVVLLGMVGYFSGVVQAPITSAVIVMEMTDNQTMTIPLLATAMLAFGVSRLIARRPLYSALAERFRAAVERRTS